MPWVSFYFLFFAEQTLYKATNQRKIDLNRIQVTITQTLNHNHKIVISLNESQLLIDTFAIENIHTNH